MLDKYGLPRKLFGISADEIPVAQGVTAMLDEPEMATAKTENAVPVTSAPEHDPSQPPWGPEEDTDHLAGTPDLNDDAVEFPF